MIWIQLCTVFCFAMSFLMIGYYFLSNNSNITNVENFEVVDLALPPLSSILAFAGLFCLAIVLHM